MDHTIRLAVLTVVWGIVLWGCGSEAPTGAPPQPVIAPDTDGDFRVGNYPPITDVQKQRALTVLREYEKFSIVAATVGKHHRGLPTEVDIQELTRNCNVHVQPVRVAGPGSVGMTRLSGDACPVRFSMSTLITGAVRTDGASFEKIAESPFRKISKLAVQQTYETSGTSNYLQKTSGTFTLPDEGEIRFLRNFRSFKDGLDGDEKIVVHFRDFTLEFYSFTRRDGPLDNDPAHSGGFINGQKLTFAGVEEQLFIAATSLTMGMSVGHIQN